MYRPRRVAYCYEVSLLAHDENNKSEYESLLRTTVCDTRARKSPDRSLNVDDCIRACVQQYKI